MTSLADFAARDGIKPGDSERWFDQHSGLLDEVVAGLQDGIRVKTIWRWLKAEHQYPYSDDTIHRIRGRLIS